jgi:hypothetical protein
MPEVLALVADRSGGRAQGVAILAGTADLRIPMKRKKKDTVAGRMTDQLNLA